jgi:hypothetical protein
VPFLTDRPESAAMLVTTVVLGVLRFTFPRDSRHRLELWKAVLEHRRHRWQVTERRRAARKRREPLHPEQEAETTEFDTVPTADS